MLSFDSGLVSSLENPNSVSFWVLKLYYNNESAFIGVSDSHRVDGSDVYAGLVSSWGDYQQSIDFFNFSSSTGNISINLINSENSIQGGRFSDLLASKNFSNRKWELFQNTIGLSTFDTPARMIGTGVISGDIKYDTKYVSFTLIDYSSKLHKKLPTNIVDSSTYANAPEANINKPIPMAYGDFYEKTDIGTIPTGHFDRFKNFYKSAFPAIITDKFDVGQAAVEAYVDIVAIDTLDDENVYFYKNNSYPTFTGTVDATSNNPRIEFSGSRAKVYFPLSTSGSANSNSGTGTHTNEANLSNGDFGDSSICEIAVTSGNSVTVNYAIPTIPKMGEYVGITALTKFGTVTGTLLGANAFLVGNVGYGAGTVVTNAELSNSIASAFSGETDTWNFEGVLAYKLNSASGAKTVEVSESGIVVEFDVENIEPRKFTELIENVSSPAANTIANSGFGGGAVQTVKENKIITRTSTKLVPTEIEYVYCSGKGREYGAWIDTVDSDDRVDENGGEPDPDYASGAFIENPVYIIEDILRRELGLDSSTDGSDINIETFDKAGNGQSGDTKGDIALALNLAVDEIRFAFSQYKFIDSKDLIERIGRQICSYVWISGDGKFKIKTLLRPTDTPTTDKTINYNDINLNDVSRTPVDSVRNSVIANYNYDYGKGQFSSQSATASDSGSNSSQSSDVEGVNQVLKLELDADTLDSDTADKIADAQLKMFKERKIILNFECLTPKYNDLEITDTIIFENWDSKIKLYGVAMGTDYFMITDISKTPFGCAIEAIQVKNLANA